MLNVDLIPDSVLSDILENMSGDDEDKKLKDLELHSFGEGFDRFMQWNGIIGYNSMILGAITGLLAAEVPFGHTKMRTLDPEKAIKELNPGEVIVITKLDTGETFARRLDDGNY